MTPEYTDYLGNPIDANDLVVYPTASGSSSAQMNLARVVAVVPIIPNDPSDPLSRSGHTPEDSAKIERGRDAPTRSIPGRWLKHNPVTGERAQRGYGDFFRDDSKAYLLKINRLQEGAGHRMNVDPTRQVTLTNVDRVVVVTTLVDKASL